MKKIQLFHSWLTACLMAVIVFFSACENEMTDAEILNSEIERMPFKTLVNNQEKAGTEETAKVYAYIDSRGEVSVLNTRMLKSSGDEKTDEEILTHLGHANFLRAVEGTANGKEVIFEVTRHYYYNPELEEANKEFVPYDKAPKPVGGFKAIQQKIVYPEMAQKAGIEGVVIVQGFITEAGDFTKYQVIKQVDNSDLDNAAVEALKQVKFKPALQYDKPVGVWITIPIVFKLKDKDLARG
jgi:TonB family protein